MSNQSRNRNQLNAGVISLPHELLLNGFYLAFSQKELEVSVVDCASYEEFKTLRAKYEHDYFIKFYDNKAYCINTNADVIDHFGDKQIIDINSYIGAKLVGGFMQSRLKEFIHSDRGEGDQHYSIIATDREIVSKIIEEKGLDHTLIEGFQILPRLDLEVRLVQIENSWVDLVLLLTSRIQYRIEVSIKALQAAGLDLTGRYVVLRKRPKYGRRYLGRIASISGDHVELEESEAASCSVDDVWLEATPANYAYCLEHLLGRDFRVFTASRLKEEANALTGREYASMLFKFSRFLKRDDKANFPLNANVNCSADRFVKYNSRLNAHQKVQSVNYCYNRAKTKVSRFSWMGLEEHGPYSRDSIRVKEPQFLVILPADDEHVVDVFLQKWLHGIRGDQSRFKKGFLDTFLFRDHRVEVIKVPSVSATDGKAWVDILRGHFELGKRYDAVIIFRASDWSVKDYWRVKAFVLQHGFPVQQIKLTTAAQDDYSLQYTLQNISIAMYAKLGGTPWTFQCDETYTDEIVMGIGCAEVHESRIQARKRYMGITTVFSGEGDYILGSASRECNYDEYADVLYSEISRLLQDLRARQGWKNDSTIKLVIHSYKSLKKVEMAEIVKRCINESGLKHIDVAFVKVERSHPFRLIDSRKTSISPRVANKKGDDSYFPDRGTIAKLGHNTRLVAVADSTLIKRWPSPLSSPLLVSLDREHSTYQDLGYLSEQVLKFTSLSWRSIYPVKMPVTITYSEFIADALGHLREVDGWSPELLGTTLKYSRWFL